MTATSYLQMMSHTAAINIGLCLGVPEELFPPQVLALLAATLLDTVLKLSATECRT